MLHLLHEIQLVSVSQHSTHPPLLTVNNTRMHSHTHTDLRERGGASEMQDLGEGHSGRTNIAVYS